MLRIKKDGKVLSLKDQEKLCEKDSTQNPGRPVSLANRPRKSRSNYPGLRPPGGDKKVEKIEPAPTKKKSKAE